MDEPRATDQPAEPAGDIGEPVAVRTYLIVAFAIVIGMILWAMSMIGY